MQLESYKQKLKDSKLFKDSFWAVFGNGLGNALMLLAGILIARLLGKDLYGEYGIVKTTMIYIASFATLGLGFTSTKYVAATIQEKREYVHSIIRDALKISVAFSCLVAILIVIFAPYLAGYMDEPSLVSPLRYLAAIIVFKSVTTTLIGILAGFKEFKSIAFNSLWSGVFLIATCVPLTYLWSVNGSLLALLLSQLFNAAINLFAMRRAVLSLPEQRKRSYSRELIRFSVPVALQESSFTICHWAAIMLLTRYSSLGEVGLYTASAQWNSIILMIPLLLYNVVLSYLSSSVSETQEHTRMLRKMLLVNFICAFVPFVFVYISADFIASFYGVSFIMLGRVLRITTFSTIFESCSSVYKSELLAQSKTWPLFTIRLFRDVSLVLLVYFFLSRNEGQNGAELYAWVLVIVSMLFLFALYSYYRYAQLTKR